MWIYADIPLTLAMTEIVIKITVGLLSVLALAIKNINHGRLGMSILVYKNSQLIFCTICREIRKEFFGRKGHKISAAKAR